MPPRNQTPQQHQRSRLLLVILSPLIWLHAVTVKPVVNFWLYTVLGAVEESISSLIREGLAFIQRSVNGFSAWVLSVSNHEYKQQLRGRWQELADKHSWWKDEVHQKSTLNAVLARSYESQSGGRNSPDVASGATAEIFGSRLSSKSSSSDKQPVSPDATASLGGSETGARAAPAAADAAVLRKQGQQQHSEIEVASDTDTAESLTQHDQSSAETSARSNSTEEESSNAWWPTTPPAWLAAVSEEAQEAAAAAQERAAAAAAQASAAVQERAAAAAAQASAAVQQAASSVSSAVEEAAAAAAALARNMRAVFGEQQAGWGASEAIRRTGSTQLPEHRTEVVNGLM
eukprot:GHUV01014183.1.p1 GENE.GHUV01014183.1~~GHUV01014183.1.p1  ORF type:complete len:345 (+),score=128.33 GHUV01014183.1:414-1448(+)